VRILYSHRIQSRDGQGVHLDAMVAALRAAGHEVLVVGPAAYDQAALGGESRLVATLRRRLPAAVAELAELAYGLPAYLRLARAAATFRPDAIYERYNLFHLAGALVARRRGLPLLVEVNAPLAEERARFGTLRLRRLARWAEGFVWRSADRLLPVTQVLAGHAAAAGVDPQRIVVVPNGIDLEDFPEPAPADATAQEDVVLGFVGFVRAWHGLDAVIRAIAAWQGQPALRLVVVGDGPARAELEHLAETLGVAARVRFTGLAPREAIPGLVAGFDIALQPAAVAYASPLKVFEYMAAGRAIVAPAQSNIEEVLEHDRTALLFDPGRPEAMWEAVLRLAADAQLRRRLGASARAGIVARDLTWAGNARRVAALIDAVRAQAAGRPGAAPLTAPRPDR
jgi:glycosyltransferase involved in cell wall biosynthesis